MTTAEAVEVIKDRELLARVAVYNPHISGTTLRLLNDLEDAARLGELPPAPLLAEFGTYVERLGKLLTDYAAAGHPNRRRVAVLHLCRGARKDRPHDG